MAGRAWSVFGRPLDMLTQDVCSLHNAHSVYTSYGGIVFAEDEANNIAAALGTTNKALIMINQLSLPLSHLWMGISRPRNT